MTAKQYLQSYKKYERLYIAAVEQIKSIDNEMISLKSPNFEERVQSSPVKDPIGEMVCALEKEKGKLSLKMVKYKTEMALIKSQIDKINEENNDYYVILLFRYVLFKDWQCICDKLHLSRSQANVIHGMALVEFDDKFAKFYAEK